MAYYLVGVWDGRAYRDPETGFLVGAEPVTLGPEDARTAVIFVHGFIGGGNNFWELPDRLAEAGFRAYVLRLPGHGTSPKDLRAVQGHELLQAVLDAVRDAKSRHQRVVLIGHSMGGALSTLAASIEPVDGLVLGGSFFRVTYYWAYVLRPEWWTRLTAPLIRWVYKGDVFIRVKNRSVKDQILSYRWIPSNASITLAHIGSLVRDPDLLRDIACPVLMFHSPNDTAASPTAAEQAFTQLGSDEKEFVWLENSDHHVFWDYEREEVAKKVLEFVRNGDMVDTVDLRGSNTNVLSQDTFVR